MGFGWVWNREGVSRRDAEFAEEDRNGLSTSACSAALRELVCDGFGLGMNRERVSRRDTEFAEEDRKGVVCLGVLGVSA
jgi:hypothetical protein